MLVDDAPESNELSLRMRSRPNDIMGLKRPLGRLSIDRIVLKHERTSIKKAVVPSKSAKAHAQGLLKATRSELGSFGLAASELAEGDAGKDYAAELEAALSLPMLPQVGAVQRCDTLARISSSREIVRYSVAVAGHTVERIITTFHTSLINFPNSTQPPRLDMSTMGLRPQIRGRKGTFVGRPPQRVSRPMGRVTQRPVNRPEALVLPPLLTNKNTAQVARSFPVEPQLTFPTPRRTGYIIADLKQQRSAPSLPTADAVHSRFAAPAPPGPKQVTKTPLPIGWQRLFQPFSHLFF